MTQDQQIVYAVSQKKKKNTIQYKGEVWHWEKLLWHVEGTI